MKKKKPLAVVLDKFYVPEHLVNIKRVKKHCTHTLYEDKVCAKCPYLQERHSEFCDVCSAYIGEIKTYGSIERNGTKYIGLPIGKKADFLDYLYIDDWNELNIRDARYDTEFDYDIKFGGPKKGELRDYQQKMAKDFLKKRYGLVESPPRSGKTISALYIGIEHGRRMLVVANQKEFLNQFLDHVYDFTNIRSLEKKHGKKLCGMAKKYEDFEQYQIATATVQTFYSEKGRELLKQICKFYGMVWIDECHTLAASVFSKTISSMPIKVKWGATGTVERKDGKHKLLYDILGPVVASSTVESLTPVVKTVWTGLKPRHAYKHWTYAMKWLAENEDRNNMIIDSILVDIEQGHSVILPCLFRNHITYITRRINAEYGSRIADFFIGGADKANLRRRETVLDEAKSGELKVVVGTRSILQLGLNVPRWSKLKSIFPISNKPNLKQETSRVRTPMVGKKAPEIEFWVDDMDQSIYCFKSSLHHVQQFGYIIDTQSYPTIERALGKLGVKSWLGKQNKSETTKRINNGVVQKTNGKIF